jgi:hypothetical protein
VRTKRGGGLGANATIRIDCPVLEEPANVLRKSYGEYAQGIGTTSTGNIFIKAIIKSRNDPQPHNNDSSVERVPDSVTSRVGGQKSGPDGRNINLNRMHKTQNNKAFVTAPIRIMDSPFLHHQNASNEGFFTSSATQ